MGNERRVNRGNNRLSNLNWNTSTNTNTNNGWRPALFISKHNDCNGYGFCGLALLLCKGL